MSMLMLVAIGILSLLNLESVAAGCNCNEGIASVTFKYTGCKQDRFLPKDNIPFYQRKMTTRPLSRTVTVNMFAWRVKALGRFMTPKYKICSGLDCSSFELSCRRNFGPGAVVGNWKVISAKTGRNFRPVYCSPRTWFPSGYNTRKCTNRTPKYVPKQGKKRTWKAAKKRTWKAPKKRIWKAPKKRTWNPNRFSGNKPQVAKDTSQDVAQDVVQDVAKGKSDSACSDDWVVRALKGSNRWRAFENQPPHKCDERLSAQAEKYSKKLCNVGGDLSHNGFFSRCEAAGYNRFCGENLLWNMEPMSVQPEKAIAQWEDSPGHRKNMVSSVSKLVGYGYHKCGNGRVYWTSLFSKPN